MEIDPPQPNSMKQKVEALQTFAGGSLASSISKLSGSSRGIPSEKDFHFYYNFDQFKAQIDAIAETSQSMLETIGNSAQVWGKQMSVPVTDDDDDDEVYDWFVNVNDEVFERFDSSYDEFLKLRKDEEISGVRVVDSDDGFCLVSGKKKKKDGVVSGSGDLSLSSSSSVKMASRDKKGMGVKPKIPFHIPTIPRPQDEYKILVNNSNQPFEHVWLQRSDDGSRFIHPLERLSFLDFVDKNVSDIEPQAPPPLASTPFKMVEDVRDLKELAAKLKVADEFAVDLEHNHYRSFQGLTCLMQISTRTHDFVVDTLKLRVHIGPYLRDYFKDPTKKKVMHGSDRDIIWLQRDFGIYICNMFDTGQASRILKLERNSLEHLLQHYCQVTANKEYQNADWRLRPLPAEMVKYAREDTHYLLFMYDLMRKELDLAPKDPESTGSPLEEVYRRSYDICMQFYEKEVLTESSYLYIYGLQSADFNAQQLAIIAGLCEWRDVVARAEDESTGYILPNKTLLDIGKQMPVTAAKLKKMVMAKHPYIERNLGSVVSIIRHSMQNASAFEAVAEQLKQARIDKASNEAEMSKTENMDGENMRSELLIGSPIKQKSVLELAKSATPNQNQISSQYNPRDNGKFTYRRDRDANTSYSASGAEVVVEVLKKPSRAFGALLGNSATKRKFDFGKKEADEIKVEQIKSSVNLPFQTFLGVGSSEPVEKEPTRPASEDPPAAVSGENGGEPSSKSDNNNAEEVIMLGSSSDSEVEEFTTLNSRKEKSSKNKNEEGLTDLSSSLEKCFQSDSTADPEIKPFDYEEARKVVRFGERNGGENSTNNDNNGDDKIDKNSKKKAQSRSGAARTEESGDFQQGRRRQAFPASGNRSATFRQ